MATPSKLALEARLREIEEELMETTSRYEALRMKLEGANNTSHLVRAQKEREKREEVEGRLVHMHRRNKQLEQENAELKKKNARLTDNVVRHGQRLPTSPPRATSPRARSPVAEANTKAFLAQRSERARQKETRPADPSPAPAASALLTPPAMPPPSLDTCFGSGSTSSLGPLELV